MIKLSLLNLKLPHPVVISPQIIDKKLHVDFMVSALHRQSKKNYIKKNDLPSTVEDEVYYVAQ